ncbi:SIS domain-containing protein [Halobacillus mangrovi]|uniref:SIS domain-containing protein n=1 Tax=Halobacillus mangrovi TaxID=402384 RepID=UPI003D99803E
MIHQYFDEVQALLERAADSQYRMLEDAAKRIVKTIEQGGVVHLFGTGHSHMLAEEGFYRAGGLAAIRPIFIESLMLHEGALRSSNLERREGLAETFMEGEDIRPEDVLIVISTSGKNPVPVDVALWGKEKGAFVISLSSHRYTEQQSSRHKSGRYLSDVADLAIDNGSPIGDAVLKHEAISVRFSSTSTVVGATLMNAMFAEAIGLLANKGEEPPVFLSGNVAGSLEHNQKLMERYKHRIDFGKLD